MLVTGKSVSWGGGCDLAGGGKLFLFSMQFCVDVYVLSPFIKASGQVCKTFQGFQEHGSNRSRIENQDSITNQPKCHTCDVSFQTYPLLLTATSGTLKGESCLFRGGREAASAQCILCLYQLPKGSLPFECLGR